MEAEESVEEMTEEVYINIMTLFLLTVLYLFICRFIVVKYIYI